MTDTKIVRRPKCLEKPVNPELSNKWTIDVEYSQLFEWALHLESRLAKYETHHADPKPGEASVVKHTQFDPDRRPECMDEQVRISRMEKVDVANKLLEVKEWAHHLESVREGLQRTVNHFEYMYQTDFAKKPKGEEQN